MKPPPSLATRSFILIGPIDLTNPVAAWLVDAGADLQRIQSFDPPQELAATQPDWDAIVIATVADDLLPLLAQHAHVGAWQLQPGGEIEPHFHLTPDLPPAAVVEILRLAECNARQSGELHSIARKLTHDFMTPLGAIITTTSALRDPMSDFSAEDREMLDAIAVSGDELKTLLLRIGFILKAGLHPPQLATVDVTDVLWELRDLVQSRVIRAQARIRWPERAPHVRGVRAWVSRMFEELIDNALKHNPPGVEISLTSQQRGDEVHYTMSHLAPTLSRPTASLIVPFEQRAARHAHGWGLTIVHRLADLQHGRVEVSLDEADRLTFRFVLPAAPESPVAAGVARLEAQTLR